MNTWDLTTLGSTMMSLTTEVGVPLPLGDKLRMDVAGAESNCAIALAGLGKRTCWLSKVGDTAVGDHVVSAIRAHGVDVSRVVRAAGRTELMWVEAGLATNRTTVTYDRIGAPMESLELSDVDLQAVQESAWFHFTGITPALSASCRETLMAVVQHARSHGVKVSCDVNYRSKLWEPDEAQAVLSPLMQGVDLLLVGRGDLQLLWQREGEGEREVKRLQEEYQIENVVLTEGAQGATGIFGDLVDQHGAFAGEVVSPIGAGDAFAAGVLSSLMNEESDLALRRGCAMASLARESRSDYVVGGLRALEAKLAEGEGKRLSR